MIRLGLTGSIGMGKSTIAQMFRDEGLAIWDADACVHALYEHSAPLQQALCEAFGQVMTKGHIDRLKLSQALKQRPDGFAALNALVHPLVVADRKAFEQGHKYDRLVIIDIPLLFETGVENEVEKILVVTAPYALQAERVLSRPTMSKERFDMILAQQVPDQIKRAKADFIIDTSKSLEDSRQAVRAIIATLLA